MITVRFTQIFYIIFFLSSQCLGQSNAFSNKIGDEGHRGPSVEAIKEAAVRSNIESDYYSAIKYYERLLAADSSVANLSGYAEVCTAFYMHEFAEMAYQKIVDKDPINVPASVLLQLASSKFNQANYVDAKEIYQSILVKAAVSNEEIEKAQKGIENCEWAEEVILNSDFNQTVESAGDGVNTVFSEFAPFPQGDTLFYTSYRFPIKKDNNNPDRYLMKVLTEVNSNGNLEVAPVDFNETKQHTSHTAIDKTGNVMYFTNCNFTNAAAIHCKIYRQFKNADGTWGRAEELDDKINVPGYTATEPNVGWDAEGKHGVLYFVSDRPNGKGALDIWSALIMDDGKLTEPTNLTSINTPEDDITPFFYNGEQTLYFSSKGYQTLGGYDIFKSKMKGISWESPEHLGAPINSNQHDIYYSLTKDGSKAYFSSNRIGSKYLTEESCCFDIYKVVLKYPCLDVVTFHKESPLDSLYGATIQLIELSGTNEEIKLDLDGATICLPFANKPGTSFVLIGSKDGYFPDTLYFKAQPRMNVKEMTKKLYLARMKVDLLVTVGDGNTLEPLPGTTCKFIDLGLISENGNLFTGRGGAPLEAKVDKNEMGNDYGYKLEFNHRYRVIISKQGYTIDSVEVTTQGLTKTTTLREHLTLYRGLQLEAFAYNKLTRMPLNGTTIKFTEIAGTRYDSRTNEKGNNFRYGLNFERKYKVVISKEGFYPDSLEFTTNGVPQDAFQTITKNLYLEPIGANKIKSFVGVKLFFDNDEPDKRTLRTKTNVSYEYTYIEYYKRKQTFEYNFSNGLSGTEIDIAKKDIDFFFEREVKTGYDNLILFSEAIFENLLGGEFVEVTIKGYASPRANPQYNKNLTSRRIDSVRNFFKRYKNGLLMPYFKNGHLIVIEEPYGESKITKEAEISDDVKDDRNSWYNVKASRERRVEIVGLTIQK